VRPHGEKEIAVEVACIDGAVEACDTVSMLMEVDLFHVSLAALVVVIVAFIVRAVRLTNASISTASRHVNLTNPDTARSLVDRMRERELPCPRCGHDTFAQLGTGNRYTCHTCHFDFEGPAHIPGSSPH
jgi:ribosomal protein S27AE